MGVLANHVPSIEALRPGVVEVIEDNGSQGKKWFGKWTQKAGCHICSSEHRPRRMTHVWTSRLFGC